MGFGRLRVRGGGGGELKDRLCNIHLITEKEKKRMQECKRVQTASGSTVYLKATHAGE